MGFDAHIFTLEETTPKLVNGKHVFVPSDRAKDFKKLRSERLGLRHEDVAVAFRISLTQAIDLEHGRLRCDWALATKVLKRYADRR